MFSSTDGVCNYDHWFLYKKLHHPINARVFFDNLVYKLLSYKYIIFQVLISFSIAFHYITKFYVEEDVRKFKIVLREIIKCEQFKRSLIVF
jgi:hypothetical protein